MSLRIPHEKATHHQCRNDLTNDARAANRRRFRSRKWEHALSRASAVVSSAAPLQARLAKKFALSWSEKPLTPPGLLTLVTPLTPSKDPTASDIWPVNLGRDVVAVAYSVGPGPRAGGYGRIPRIKGAPACHHNRPLMLVAFPHRCLLPLQPETARCLLRMITRMIIPKRDQMQTYTLCAILMQRRDK
jgi:hypothetical protein